MSNNPVKSVSVCVCVRERERERVHAQLCPTLQPHGLYIAHQAPPSMGFSRQEYWSGLPFSHPGDLPDPGIRHMSPESPTL